MHRFNCNRVPQLGPIITGLLLALSPLNARAGANVLTQHNDNARSGLNTNETQLTPANVGSTNFGQLFTQPVDGFVYAQPLVMTNVAIPAKGIHNVVFVATEHDSVYAFDADNDSGGNAVPLWQVSFINPAAGVTSVPGADVACTDLLPEIGITSTPVIDPVSGTIYVEAKTEEVTNGVTTFVHRLHALDVATGAEKFGGPVVIQASVPGTGDGNDGAGNVPFLPITHMNRPGLLLSRGIVYLGYASHCDNGPYHGWLLGYDAHTLAFTNVFNATPNGGDGGIWQSGNGPAADTNGNIFAMTGNGTFDSTNNNDYGDSILKFSTTNGLQLADYFTPSNQDMLNSQDLDLGSAGPMLLPDAVGSIAHRHLLVGGSKTGTIYLVDRDNLGGYDPMNDNIVEEMPNAIGGTWSSPAFFNNTIYFQGSGDVLNAFPISQAFISPTPSAQGPDNFGFPGATPSISANGTNNGIVWALQTDAFGNNGPEILHAYDATNVASVLYNSDNVGQDPGGAVKFAVPTIANGKVYAGAQYALAVYGLGAFLAAPAIAPNGATFTNSLVITLSNAAPGATLYYTLDGSTPTTNGLHYTGPFVITNSLSVKARAFQTGAVNSQVTAATFIISRDVGAGTGLTGEYFTGQSATFNNPPTLVRTDATINFDWTTVPPDPLINGTLFTVRWTGSVQPLFNETYTFYANTSDGALLWVNGQLLVNEWNPQSATEWRGSIPLTAGRRYSLALEYFENSGSPSAQLAWSSPSTVKSIIPQSQLYRTFAPSFVSGASAFTAGEFQTELFGLPGKDYALQATPDFKTWTSISTNFSPVNPAITVPTSLFNFTDSPPTNFPYRFYRAFQLP
jgi:hypothetical protein